MIIDVHAHHIAPRGFGATPTDRGAHGRPRVSYTDEQLDAALTSPTFGGGSLIEQMAEVSTDMQLLSPRPIGMAHHEKPAKLVHWHIEDTNNIIARQCAMHPDLFRGVAGLPQSPDESPAACIPELERAVKELGMVGALINPDPGEGFYPPPPAMGDEYWYPLYEKFVELDVPVIIHPAQYVGREQHYSLHFINEETTATISLLASQVFVDFPTLKIIVSHGGGSIPYQTGRWTAFYARPERQGPLGRFEEALPHIYFDSAVYSRAGLECLIREVGADNILFGTERPGQGAVKDPKTGRTMDDIKPHIDSFDWLSEVDRDKIYEGNARRLFRL